MAKIQRLSTHVANLIAAGEVVERPASVVKELLENAVDAGATSVTVEIQNGGMTFIRVTDNGCGMSAEDAEVAFLRHATSKLRSEADLAAIGTLGFRGEALAAIASVSHIELMTSDGGEGISLRLEAGQIVRRSPAGCPQGTTILVRDLFFNTPARMKFMKRDSAEGAQVHSIVQQQALANPAVSYRFLRDGQEVLRTTGDGALYNAVYAVLGRQLALDMVELDGSWEGIALHGYVTRPTATRGNRGCQHFFVNGRYIKSRLLCSALEQAYANQLAAGRYPGCVLHVELPLNQVDVNVHPAKTEVKFLNEKQLFDAVHYGVLSALRRAPGKPEAKLPPVSAPVSAPVSNPAPAAKPAQKAVPKPGFYRTMQPEEYRRFAAAMAETPPASPAVAEQIRRTPTTYTAPIERAAVPLAQPKSHLNQSAAKPTPAPKPAPEPEPEQQAMPLPPAQEWRLVGEVLHTYLVIDAPDGMLLIDKHAAHERILFEKLKAQKTEMMSQTLLDPLPARLTAEEAEIVLAQAALLAQFGFGLEPGEPGEAVLTRIPAELSEDGAEAALQELAQRLLEGQQPDPDAMRDTVLHTVACKAAIKAGWLTDAKELEALAREVLSRDDIKYCPHGRPVCVSLSRSTIERQFGRA